MTDFAPTLALEEAHCLLEWIHTFPNSHYITSLIDINHSSLVVQILKDLDGQLYKTLTSSQIQGSSFAWQLSRYLLKNFQKGVIILNSYQISELVSKLLYVCVHSKNKQAFIQKILSLDEQVQGILMKLIEKTQNQIVVVKQSGILLNKIADLETANEQLQSIVDKNTQDYQQLNTLLEATKVQLKGLQQQCQKYRKQKQETMRQLQIPEFSNYISVYRKIQQQNNESFNTLKDLQQKLSKLDEQNKNLKQKIIQDGLVIAKYHQDSNQMRSSLKKLRSIKRKNHQFQIFDHEDTEIDTKSLTSSYICVVKQLQNHIASQKQKFSKQSQEYTEQISLLVNQNSGLRKMTRYLSGQICQLQKVYKEVRQVIPV